MGSKTQVKIDESKLSLAYLTNSLDPIRFVQNLRVSHACFIHFFSHDGPHLQR